MRRRPRLPGSESSFSSFYRVISCLDQVWSNFGPSFQAIILQPGQRLSWTFISSYHPATRPKTQLSWVNPVSSVGPAQYLNWPCRLCHSDSKICQEQMATGIEVWRPSHGHTVSFKFPTAGCPLRHWMGACAQSPQCRSRRESRLGMDSHLRRSHLQWFYMQMAVAPGAAGFSSDQQWHRKS